MSTKLFLFTAFIISMLLMSVNNRRKKKRIVFFGDSITEQGAKAGGYIPLIAKELEKAGLGEKYELVGAGISGNKVTDLHGRLKRDVLWNGVEILVIFIGVNDVWHKGSPGKSGTDIEIFETMYKEIVSTLLDAEIKIILCTPTLIGENVVVLSEKNRELETYCGVVRGIAKDYGVPLADLRKAFIIYNHSNNPANADEGILTTDTVHLNAEGNRVVADAIWPVLQQLLND